MRASDVEALDRLLHPELVAVGPDGRLVDKAGDLDAHRSGVFTITELEEEDVRVKVIGTTAITFVVLRVSGTIAGGEVGGRLRYTRTWVRDGGCWRVVAATSVQPRPDESNAATARPSRRSRSAAQGRRTASARTGDAVRPWPSEPLPAGRAVLDLPGLAQASIVSSTVRRTVVSNELSAPPPLIASATAAMDTLSA